MKFIEFWIFLFVVTGFQLMGATAQEPPPNPDAGTGVEAKATGTPAEIDLTQIDGPSWNYSRSYIDVENVFPKGGEAYCNIKETKDHTRFLLTSYRALFTFMQEVQRKSPWEEFKHGSVVFLNWQDQAMKLMVPEGCEKSNQLNLYVYFGVDKAKSTTPKYEEVRQGLMDAFNKQYGDKADRPELHLKSFNQRNYFRTVTLYTENKIHHFNIFTRPLGYTTFPVPTYVDHFNSTNEIRCEMKKVKEMLEEQELALRTEPFRFFWKFPSPGDNEVPSDDKKVPTSDIIYWDTFNDFNGSQWERKYECKNPDLTRCSVGEIESGNDELEEGHGECKLAQFSKVHVRSKHDVGEDYLEEEYELTSGRLSCITMDRYGLTSAFWWEDDKFINSAPMDAPFRGFANNRTRTIWPLITLGIIMGAMLAITLLFIFFGKQWNEDSSKN